VSALGRATALAAEAALWVTGAALIASAAGVSLDVPSLDLSALTGSSPSPAVSGGPHAGPRSTAIATLAPGASPTLSAIVREYQAFVASPDFQFQAKYTSSSTFTSEGTAYDVEDSGTMSYKAGDDTQSYRETVNGTVTTYDQVDLGSTTYVSKNGAAWTRSARPATQSDSDKLMFAPASLFLDQGVETKDGAQLHRLTIADPVAYTKALLKVSSSGATDGLISYTVWVTADGTPGAISLQGWSQTPVNGVSTRVTIDQEFRIVATSGVAIGAPI
jgi:hypothetical protein